MMKFIKKQKGYTLLEVLISITIFSIVFIAIVNLYSTIFRTELKNEFLRKASIIADNEMLDLLKIDSVIIDLFSDKSNEQKFLLQTLFYKEEDDVFQKEVYLKIIDWDKRLVKILIKLKWVDKSDIEREYEVMTIEHFNVD